MRGWAWRVVLAVVFCAWPAAGTQAQQKPPAKPAETRAVWKVARGAAEPKALAYRPEMLKSVPKEYLTEYAACCLFSGVTVRVDDTGASEDVYHTLVRLNNAAAVEEQGECRILFQPEFQTLILNEARVHTARGETIDIRPEHIHLRDMNTDYQVYSTAREAIISFPGLTVGDVLEMQWTVKGRDPEFAPQWVAHHVFNETDAESVSQGDSSDYPIYQAAMSVTIPNGRTLRHAAFGRPLIANISETATTRTYAWSTTELLPPPLEDPEVTRENFQVGVACSTFDSWDAVAQWEIALRKGRTDCTPEIRALVQKLTKGLPTLTEQVRALCRFVRSDMRYLSRGHGEYGNRPHPPGEVLANRFGDCKDKTQLLAVMLRELNVPVEYVVLLAEGSGQMLAEVPSPIADHIFLRVTVDGKSHWVDPTGIWCGWNQLREDCQGRPALIFNEQGGRFELLPELKPEDCRIVCEAELTVDTDTKARMKVRQTFHGLAAADLRIRWLGKPARNRRDRFLKEFENYYEPVQLTDLLIDERQLADPDLPIDVRFTLDLGELFHEDTKEAEWVGRMATVQLWQRLLAYRPAADRRAGLDMPVPFEMRDTLRIKLPPTHQFGLLPLSQHLDAKWGHFDFDVLNAQDPHIAVLVWSVRLTDRHILEADLPEYRKFDEAAGSMVSHLVHIYRTDDEEDVERLQAYLQDRPEDPRAWLTLVDLLASLERQDEAEATLKKALVKHAGDRPLQELRLIFASSLTQETEIYRDLVRRWPEEGKFTMLYGLHLIEREQFADAEKVLMAGLEKFDGVWALAGCIYMAELRVRQKRFADGYALLEKAITLDEAVEEQPSFQEVRGKLLEGEQKWAAAARHYGASLELHPREPGLLTGSIRTAIQQKNRADALRHLWTLISVSADDPPALARSAKFSQELERWEDAELLAQHALELDSAQPDALAVLDAVKKRRQPPVQPAAKPAAASRLK